MQRYIRNMQLEGWGPEAQERVAKAHVLVIGAGALGSAAAMYLAASGVGRITIVDFDNIDITNLQRQLSYTEADLGKPKAETLAMRLRAINSEVEAVAINAMVSARNLAELRALMQQADVVVEGSDNPPTKYLVADMAESMLKPYALGGIAQYSGQALSWRPGAPGYRSVFPDGADAGGYTPCSVGGVLGPLPGIIGSMQAIEALKLITGIGTPLLGRLFTIDALTMTSRTFAFQ